MALGSNLNDPQARIFEAFDRIAGIQATRLVSRSRLYATRPMGPRDQPDFINAAAGLLTQLGARQLLLALLDLERQMGRNRQERWGPRVIDLDLIFMPGIRFEEPGLTVPHPGVSERNFVLYPLHDIAPTLDIPGHGRVTDMKLHADAGGILLLK